MSSGHDIEQYYELLELDANASWDELRKSFKRKAQQHHPDRYLPGSIEHEQATLTFKTVTQAFRAFEEYFKIHGQLPPRVKPRPPQPDPAVVSSDFHNSSFRSATRHHKVSSSRNRRAREGEVRKGFRYFLWFLISMLIAAYLIVENPSTPNTSAPTEQKGFQSSKASAVAPIKLSFVNLRPAAVKSTVLQENSLNAAKHFTFGSELTLVISIHGAPDRTEGSRVFYQQSWVEIENNLVTNWYADPSFPLATSLE